MACVCNSPYRIRQKKITHSGSNFLGELKKYHRVWYSVVGGAIYNPGDNVQVAGPMERCDKPGGVITPPHTCREFDKKGV